MSSIELRFDNPWLLLLAIPALALILLPFFRLPVRLRRTPRRITSTVIHAAAVLLLTLLLAGGAIVRTTTSQAVILLLDLSDSTLTLQDAMWEKARELHATLGEDVSAGTVVFGGDCVYSAEQDANIKPEKTAATDLASALEYAAAKLPGDKTGRIILLSDGKQTDGNADSTAQYLHTQGIRVDAVYFDTTVSSPEAQIRAFFGPESAYTDRQITFTAELESTGATEGTLTLQEGQTLVSTTPVTLQEGTTVVELSAPTENAGLHTYSLTLSVQADTQVKNNTAVACVQVAEHPSVLIVAGFDADPAGLQGLLAQNARAEVCSPSKVPRKITELCDYDGVILLNVNADDLPKSFGTLAEEYVSVHGRSLLAVGGANTFMYGGMRSTVLEDMMPVSFSLNRTSENDSVALMLVMDCSLSMSQQSAFMSVAKQGSIKCVESMTSNDYVGLISFNQTAVVEAPLAKNTDSRKAELNRIISGLTTSQGTYYTDALALARQELLDSTAPIRHILFVSDGGPADTTYQNLLPQLVQDGITVSTIGLGYSSTILSNMAEQCGGSYYFVKEATELPDIMLSLTEQISVNSLMTGAFAPNISVGSTAFEDFTLSSFSLPLLNGYLGTTLKRGAEALLTVGEDHPLYATWQYGSGIVSCFTSDMSQPWCGQWLENDRSRALLQRIVRTSLPETPRDSSMTAVVTPLGQSAILQVQTANKDLSVLTAVMDGISREMPRVDAGVYRVTLDIPEPGIYPVSVTQSDTSGDTIDTLQCIVVLTGTAEYDAFAAPGNLLLTSLCSHSGGSVTDDTEALVNIPADSINVVNDFRTVFGIIIAIALLADIAIRKLRWRDIKNLLLILKNK